MDLPLAWAIRLEGKTDQERFEELGWGLRTWDQWSFKEWGTRFSDDWPVRHRERSGEAGGSSVVGTQPFGVTSPPWPPARRDTTLRLGEKRSRRPGRA